MLCSRGHLIISSISRTSTIEICKVCRKTSPTRMQKGRVSIRIYAFSWLPLSLSDILPSRVPHDSTPHIMSSHTKLWTIQTTFELHLLYSFLYHGMWYGVMNSFLLHMTQVHTTIYIELISWDNNWIWNIRQIVCNIVKHNLLLEQAKDTYYTTQSKIWRTPYI